MEYTFNENQAITDSETHEKVIELFNNIEAHGKKSKLVWEDVPPEEDVFIERYNIIFESKEYYDYVDECSYKTPWLGASKEEENFQGFNCPFISSEEKYKKYLKERDAYRNKLNQYIFSYSKNEASIYKGKLLEFQKLLFKDFNNLLNYIKQLSEEKNIILNWFIYNFTDIELKNKEDFRSEREFLIIDTPKISFYINFALVDKEI